MKVLKTINVIDPTTKEQVQAGKWSNYSRIFVLQRQNGKYVVVSLNILDRMIKSFIGDKRFFEWKNQPDVTVLKVLSQESQKTSARANLEFRSDPKSNGNSHKLESGSIQKNNSSSLNSDSIQNERKGEKVVENKEKYISRVIGRGLLGSGVLSDQILKTAEEKYDEILSTGKLAKNDYQLTISDMGIGGIDFNGLQIFIRNLVMNGKIFGYKTSRIGYILYLTSEDAKNDLQKRIESQYFDKDKLITVDGKLEALRLPSEEEFPEASRKEAKILLGEIQRAHYSRAIENQDVKATSHKSAVRSFSHVNKMMDLLVLKGIIHSWGIGDRLRQVEFTFNENDERNLYVAKDSWRDIQVIKQEAEFKKKNQILASDDAFKDLNPAVKEAAIKILQQLNERVKAGLVDFYGDDHYSHLALKFLKEEKFIYDFIRSRSGAFEIFVKESD